MPGRGRSWHRCLGSAFIQIGFAFAISASLSFPTKHLLKHTERKDCIISQSANEAINCVRLCFHGRGDGSWLALCLGEHHADGSVSQSLLKLPDDGVNNINMKYSEFSNGL